MTDAGRGTLGHGGRRDRVRKKAGGLLPAALLLTSCGSPVPPLPPALTATTWDAGPAPTAVVVPGCWQAEAAASSSPAFPWRWDAGRGDWGPTAAAPTAYPTGPDTGWDLGSVQDGESGWYAHPVLRQRQGLFWHEEVLGIVGTLATITTLPDGDVWALGSSFGQGPPGGASQEFGNTFVVHGRPGRWLVDQLDEGTDLDRSLIQSADDIWLAGGIWFGGAGGAQSPAIRHWDGQHWQVARIAFVGVTPLPEGDGQGRITTIAALSGVLRAVGWTQVAPDQPHEPLALRYANAGCGRSSK